MNIRTHSLTAALALALLSTPLAAPSQPGWAQYARNAQHTALSPTPAQTMAGILWTASVDHNPQYSGEDLLIHYGTPLVTANGTVVLSVKIGVSDGFQVEGRASDGSLIYVQPTDFSLPPHNWTPSMGNAISSDNKLYVPGAGGTIYCRANADAPSSTVTQLCFYGLSTYLGDKATFDANVKICTPLTVDSGGNVFFGFVVLGGNGAGLTSGLARISAAGVGSWVSADSLSTVSGSMVGYNCTPAISNDGTLVYVVTHNGDNSSNRLCAANAATLAPTASTEMYVPGGSSPAYVLDDGTSSPMVGPDDDVYYGCWTGWNHYRGFMQHFDKMLTTVKPIGAFGWDNTASVVPATCVPSYHGTSTYLILTKYNNYIGPGDGMNRVAILDPNDTETDPVSGLTTMKEVITVLGPTLDLQNGGVREWCINTAAVDPATKSAVVNSEDGSCYRWDFTTNTLIQTVVLTDGIGEAYTPTLIGPDGLAYAISNAGVYALWDQVAVSSVSIVPGAVLEGSNATGTVTLSGNATGPGATISLSSNNAAASVPATILVPAGQPSASFTISTTVVDADTPVQITARRYTTSAVGSFTVQAASLASLTLNPTTVVGGNNSTGTVTLNAPAGPSGASVALSSNNGAAQVSGSVLVPSGQTVANFTITTSGVAAQTTATIQAQYHSVTKTAVLTIKAARLVSMTTNLAVVVGGNPVTLTIHLDGAAPTGGLSVALSANSKIILCPAQGVVPAGASTVDVIVNTKPPVAGGIRGEIKGKTSTDSTFVTFGIVHG